MSESPAKSSASESSDLLRAAWRRLPSRILALSVLFDLFFVAVFIALTFMQLRNTILFRAFDLDLEANLPTGWASFQLFFLGLCFLVLGSRLIPIRSRSFASRPLWVVLGVGFALLALDEQGMIHERLPVWRLRVFNVGGFDPWIVMYATIAVVLAVLLGKYVILAARNWPKESILFVVGLGLASAGALALEAFQQAVHLRGMLRMSEVGLEEGVEMLGASIMVFAALRILSWVMTSDLDTAAGVDSH